jgi:CheY-like chemotaxis protein
MSDAGEERQSCRVLVVEDNSDNREMLVRRLRRRGFQVEEAADGAACLAAASASPPDVILLDLSLPVMDGWHTAETLRAQEQTAAIPIIALTAHAMAEDRAKALDSGCDDYESKPVDFERLLEKIAKLCGRDAS